MDQNQFDGLHENLKTHADAYRDQAGDVANQAEKVAEDAGGKIQQGYERTRERVADVAADVSRQAREATAAAGDRLSTVGEAVEATIHDRPMLAIATAAAIGYCIAFLIHRK